MGGRHAGDRRPLWEGAMPATVGGRHAGDLARPSVRLFLAGMARYAALYFSARNIPPNGSTIIARRASMYTVDTPCHEQATGGRDVLRPK